MTESAATICRPLNLVINGRFLGQRATGVQRVAREFINALDTLLSENAFAGLTAALVAPESARPFSIALQNIALEFVPGGKGHYWEQITLARRAAGSTLLCLGNTAPMLSLMSGQRVAVMLHDQAYKLFPDDYSLPYRVVHSLLDRAILKHARPLFTVSESEKSEILKTHDGAVVVAPNGSWINDRRVADVVRISPPPHPYGIYVGGFSARKNIDAMFRIAQRLALSRRVGFRFVGDMNAHAEAYVRALPEAARHLIVFTGRVSNDELEHLYRDASFLLYPSFYEASGLPPSEAMTFGCPVVVSDLPVMRERCGDAAQYCDPHDDESIASAIIRILDDPPLAADLSARGFARVQQLTWRDQAMGIVRAIDKAYAGGIDV